MKRDTKIVALALTAIPVFILGASSLCSWIVAHGASPRWRLLFRMLCHGIEERCLKMFGVAMPICARCTGIYIGLLLGIAIFVMLPIVEERLIRVAMFIAAAPMAIDGLSQAAGLRTSTNPLRIVTGLVAAVTFGYWVLTAVEQERRRAVNPS